MFGVEDLVFVILALLVEFFELVLVYIDVFKISLVFPFDVIKSPLLLALDAFEKVEVLVGFIVDLLELVDSIFHL